MSVEFVCGGCGKKEKVSVSYAAHVLPLLGCIPSGWGFITLYRPRFPCPNQVSPGFPVIGPQHYIVCSIECAQKILAGIQQELDSVRSSKRD